MSDPMKHLLEWMLDYEIRSCERYGHPVSLILVSTEERHAVPRGVFAKSVRRSDGFFELADRSAILMRETPKEGALSAVERFAFVCDDPYDLRFGVAGYPEDGTDREALLVSASKYLESAIAGNRGPVAAAL